MAVWVEIIVSKNNPFVNRRLRLYFIIYIYYFRCVKISLKKEKNCLFFVFGKIFKNFKNFFKKLLTNTFFYIILYSVNKTRS